MAVVKQDSLLNAIGPVIPVLKSGEASTGMSGVTDNESLFKLHFQDTVFHSLITIPGKDVNHEQKKSHSCFKNISRQYVVEFP